MPEETLPATIGNNVEEVTAVHEIVMQQVESKEDAQQSPSIASPRSVSETSYQTDMVDPTGIVDEDSLLQRFSDIANAAAADCTLTREPPPGLGLAYVSEMRYSMCMSAFERVRDQDLQVLDRLLNQDDLTGALSRATEDVIHIPGLGSGLAKANDEEMQALCFQMARYVAMNCFPDSLTTPTG